MARPKTRYVASLDGLRALAVLAVIAYHMKMSWAPGGLLGVTMFFVLSGYLITGLLLAEYDESGTISLSNFWLRRVRRIVPAIVFAVLGTGMLCTIFDQALLTKMRPDVLPTLLFFNNWWQIFHNVSYFQALGEPSPLTHCWSLAIEEQFYLVWPVVLLVCMKAGVRKSTMQKGVVVLVVLSALEMALLFSPTSDPSRVYYGTDTRAFSLLIGALLAFIWPYQDLTEKAGVAMGAKGRAAFNAVGIAVTVGLLVMVALTNGFEPFIYRGGLLLCSLLTAVAIAVMVHPISLIGKVFALPPLVWIGKRSYSMYLWHYPLTLLMTPNNLVGDAPWWLRVVQLVAIFALSAFSYTFVENPIRHGAIGNFLADLSNRRITLAGWATSHVVTLIVTVAVVGTALGGFAFVPDTFSVGNVDAMQQSEGSVDGGDQSESGAMEAVEPTVEPYDMLLIGDSVPASLDGYGVFEKYFPTGHIDATVGRQFYNAPDVYAYYRDAGYVGDVVVFGLGTNGYTTDDQTDALMQLVGPDKHVWLINTRSPEEYMESSNAAILRCVEKYDNVQLIDWFAASADHEDYFDGDGTHLTLRACAVYAQLIYDAIVDYLPQPDAGAAGDSAAVDDANVPNGDSGQDGQGEASE